MTLVSYPILSNRLSYGSQASFGKIQISRSKSAGSSDRKCGVKMYKDDNKICTEIDRDYLSDHEESVTGRVEVKHHGPKPQSCFASVPTFFDTHLLQETISSVASSDSSLNLSASESGEDDFHPEKFGLLDNPGVVRFACVDYPEEVSEYGDDEDLAVTEHNTAPSWIRVSYDDLFLYSNTNGDDFVDRISDTKILSRSVEDIFNVYGDGYPEFTTRREQLHIGNW